MGMRFRSRVKETQPIVATTRVGDDAAWSLTKWPPTPPLEHLRAPSSTEDDDNDDDGEEGE